VQPRAKSQQQLHRSQPAAAAAADKPAFGGSARPRSTQSTARGGSGNTAKEAAPRVAFGRKIEASGPKKVTPLPERQKKLVKAGGAATGRLMLPAAGRASARGGGGYADQDNFGSPPMAPRGGGGFQALAGKAKGGGMMVSYEDDLGGGAPRNGGGGGVNRRSTELDGESEYLRIGGEEVDLISGDQLDRLLTRARGTRGGRDY